MARQRKRIRAGELVVETLYSVVDSRQPAAHRAARTRASSMAQQLLNHKNSLLRLKLLHRLKNDFDTGLNILQILIGKDHTTEEGMKVAKALIIGLGTTGQNVCENIAKKHYSCKFSC